MTSKDPLLQPFRLKHLTLRNRIVSTSHEPAYTEDGLPKQRYRAYHEEKAKGGIALTMIGGSSIVGRDSPAAFGNIRVWDDAVVPWFAELSEAVHRHGAAVMCQITHLGRRTGWNTGDWLPVVAPSPLREPAHRAFPKEAEDWDLARIVAQYAAAARRCRDGGLDGIEIEAYGHLLDGFWSPATNKRSDAYGGSRENRLRFTREVLAAIRAEVGSGFVVGIRLVVDEAWQEEAGPVGFGADEGLAIARALAGDRTLDFFSVIRGHIESDEALSHVIPIMGTPAAPHLAAASRIKAELGLPVMHAARIADVATARHAVAEGHLDLVGMTRAHLADPHIAARVARGEEDRIRPCVGAAYCIDRIYENGEALCIHNAATGRELTMPQVVERSAGPRQKVVVVGAGAAGLEAARVSAERGHEVVVFEAGDRAGGQIVLAAALQRRRELLGIVDWRLAELERLGVPLHFNRYAEAGDVLAERPDLVVVATGGLPNTGFLKEGEELVTTSWDLLSGAAKPGESVLLFDDNGGHPGLTAAEALCEAGARLELVTPERILAPDVGGMNYPAYLAAFQKADATITLGRRLKSVRRDGNALTALLWSDYSRDLVERRVDQVVVEHGTLPLDELYFALKPLSANRGEVDQEALLAGRPQTLVRNPEGAFRLFRIGDAVSCRNIHAAIYDALRLAKDF
ncbi:2,4-dienoyl-CoA reductase [Tistlia consotensis]|uniref:2,4-dienoyl-CoA reductase n=1 Tax=Tistlia consotensis USBA 355 TaxID=560819 RepID=A0A1Y6CA75_9PROT|nr:NADH:flavin oxidoreductase [Tistlia consotensis]SMF54034.1 2,4-dienoyl-CoA reductase [Tistlia consotensis USBA 355]SNR86447.1 2,4-dienoyl-CoA reductase [Tistlia consotensis]